MYISDEGIKLGSTDDKVHGTIFGYVDLIRPGFDVGTELGFKMDPLLILIMSSLRYDCLETHWGLLLVKCTVLMMASNWDNVKVKFLALYLEMYMESRLGLMVEQSWDIFMGPLMILNMESLRAYCVDTHWYILMVKCMDLMKASTWYLLMIN